MLRDAPRPLASADSSAELSSLSRALSEVAPGILATLLLWLISGELFGRYLA